MAEIKSGVILIEGEALVAELEAELWATSSNPIAQLLGDITKFISGLLGFKKKGFLVITNQRVVEVFDQINCYVFNTGRTVKYLLPQSIKEVGYAKKATCGFCCPGFYLYYEGLTQRTQIMLRGSKDADAQKFVDSFYNAIKS